MDSGVYLLRSLSVPRTIYVGSTRSFKHRKAQHFNTFAVHKSEHPLLQKHVDDYGIDDLYFAIIKRCPVEKLLERELYWNRKLMPSLNTRLMYNEGGKKWADALIQAEHDAQFTRKYMLSLDRAIRQSKQEIIPLNVF